MKNQEGLNQFLVDPPLEIKHHSQQLVIVPHTQRRSYCDLFHPDHLRQQFVKFSLLIWQGKAGQDGDDSSIYFNLTPPACRSTFSCAICASVASTSGNLVKPPGNPIKFKAAFVRIAPCVRKVPVNTGSNFW